MLDNLPIALDKKYSKALEKINSFMPEIRRGIEIHAKQNSQTTLSLMTLNMMDSGPYRVLRQILAQINKKNEALRENSYRLAKLQLKVKELGARIKRTELEELKLSKYRSDVIAAEAPVTNCIKEIGALQQRYKEVIKNNNLPENWTEKDFEKAEIEHHIKSIFRNAIRDRMAGTYNNGTMEYMEQFGIEPVFGYAMVDKFLSLIKKGVGDNMPISIDMRYKFYDDMYNLFKDEYKRPLKKIGLDSVTYDEWMLRGEPST